MKSYELSWEETVKKLNSDHEKGLNETIIPILLRKYGSNLLDTKNKINPLKIFIQQFKSFIIYILLFAVAFSILIGEIVDATIILIILMANAIIGYLQEISAQKSLEALKKLTKIKAKVLREGTIKIIDSKNLVPGDIIVLEAGDKVPADCRLIEVNRFKVAEAALTGESNSVNKQIDKIEQEVQIGDMNNMIFSSTNVTQGTAKAIVVETGMKTQIGKITQMIKETKEELTPLQVKLNRFGRKLGYLILSICLIIFLISFLQETLTNGFRVQAMLPVILIAISLAVAAVPEGLPAVVTVALSIGVKKLLKKKALVSKLSSVETLGSCDVICSDKTGTITKNEMTVTNCWILDDETKIEGVGYNPVGHVEKELNSIIYKIGLNCNNASIYKEKNVWKISGDPTEAALIVSSKKNKINDKLKKHEEIPFDSDRKLMSVLVEENKKLFTYTKGAPDKILDVCSHTIKNGKIVKLTSELKKDILNQNSTYAKKALRVLGFAYKQINSKKEFLEKNLIFVGFQAMIDPARPDVVEAIKKTKEANIRVIMITGDFKETAKAIANEVGIYGEILTGDDLNKMSERDLKSALKNNTNIFARVIPEHKYKIVQALQDLGHTVAMTGDGVNDAPALKKANIGVAVGSGTDVAKEASDLILLDDSFSHIVNAIEEGRGIYDNIQKVILHLLSGNLAEVLVIFLAVLLGFNLPLTAIFLLWINLITDGAPALALSVDPYNPKIMERKPIPRNQGIITKKWWRLIVFLGIITTSISLFMFSKFGGNSLNEHDVVLAQSMVFTFIVITETLLLLMIRSIYKVPIYKNSWLWTTIFFSLFMQFIVLYSSLNKIFETVPLGMTELFALGIGAVIFLTSFLIYRIIDESKWANQFSN